MRKTHQLRIEWRSDALVEKVIPIDVLEEGMSLDRSSIVRSRTQSKALLSRQKLQKPASIDATAIDVNEQFTYSLQNGDGVLWHVDGVEGLIFQDRVKDFIFVLSTEWGLAEEHFVDEDTKGPPIHGAAIFGFEKNLKIHQRLQRIRVRSRRDVPQEP